MLVLFDGSNVMRRALAVGQTVDAAVAITMRIVKSNIRLYKATHVAFLFDPAGKTFRHELYSKYKANRKRDPKVVAAMKELEPRVRDRLLEAGIRPVRKSGYEADDLIAAFVRQCDMPSVIVSNDKDMAQLLDGEVTLVRQAGEITKENCEDKIGAIPERVVCYLMALGDDADNVPGIKGVGPAAAKKLIATASRLEDSDTGVLNKGQRLEFENARKRFVKTRKLIELADDCIEVDIDRYRYVEHKAKGFMGV